MRGNPTPRGDELIPMRTRNDHIVFAGGGTAGHLFPGLAVAEQLRRYAPEVRVTFVGTGKPFETRYAKRAGFDYVALPCQPFPRKARETLRFLTDNFAGYYVARKFLREQDVSLVVGLGGYASVPAVRAAARLQIRHLLLEQNAVPGRATRWLAPTAALVCSAFEDIRPYLRATCRVRVTGNPLRREFVDGRIAVARAARSTRRSTNPGRTGRQRRRANTQRADAAGALQGRCGAGAAGKSCTRPANATWDAPANCMASWESKPRSCRLSKTCRWCCAPANWRSVALAALR